MAGAFLNDGVIGGKSLDREVVEGFAEEPFRVHVLGVWRSTVAAVDLLGTVAVKQTEAASAERALHSIEHHRAVIRPKKLDENCNNDIIGLRRSIPAQDIGDPKIGRYAAVRCKPARLFDADR